MHCGHCACKGSSAQHRRRAEHAEFPSELMHPACARSAEMLASTELHGVPTLAQDRSCLPLAEPRRRLCSAAGQHPLHKVRSGVDLSKVRGMKMMHIRTHLRRPACCRKVKRHHQCHAELNAPVDSCATLRMHHLRPSAGQQGVLPCRYTSPQLTSSTVFCSAKAMLCSRKRGGKMAAPVGITDGHPTVGLLCPATPQVARPTR